MSRLSSHVLDVALGQPARGLMLRLDFLDGNVWRALAATVTDDNGRAADLLAGGPLQARVYRLTFETGTYFAASGRFCFYPRVEVIFEVAAPAEHYHVPLLLAPYGYSTYRGS